MLSKQEKLKIKRGNKEIEDAVSMSQMMDHDGYKIFRKRIKDIEKEYRFQDITGIKEGALADQKGIVLGMNLVLNFLEDQKRTALQPRHDPETGEEEKMKNKAE